MATVASAHHHHHASLALAAAPSTHTSLQRTLLSPLAFCVVWWSVLGVHVFCGSFALALATIHGLLTAPDLFEYTSTSLQTSLPMLRSGTATFAVLAALHGFVVVRMASRSIAQRQLSFVRLQRRHAVSSQTSASEWRRRYQSLLAERRQQRSRLRRLVRPLHVLYSLWRRYFGIDGLFGLNGERFETMFTVREVVEMLAQLYQTYALSGSVATHWINALAVSVVAVNSVSGLVIRLACRAARTHTATRHLLTLIVDVVLDFSSSMLIPVCIMYQILSEFDWNTMTIPLTLINNDEWLVRRIAELHQLIITSTVDLVSTLALHVGALGAMLMIACDLRRDQRKRHPLNRIAVEPKAVYPHMILQTATASHKGTAGLWRGGQRLVDLFFLACGVSAIALRTVSAPDKTVAPFCIVHLGTWFVTKYPCAAVRINCHRFSPTDTVASILQSLDETVLVSVVFVHCADAIEIPLALRTFRAIRQLRFINVSSIAWAPDLLLDKTHFPSLSYVLFGHTNMTSVPTALLHSDLPTDLKEIEWSHSNLSVLPTEIGNFWSTREWISIVFDHTQLTTLPQSFSQIRCRHVSLASTLIETLPSDAIHHESLRRLVVSGSPLTSLHVSLFTGQLQQVMAEYTQIAVVPNWLRTWSAIDHGSGSGPALALYGSPACRDATNASQWGCDRDLESGQGITRWDILWPNVPINPT